MDLNSCYRVHLLQWTVMSKQIRMDNPGRNVGIMDQTCIVSILMLSKVFPEELNFHFLSKWESIIFPQMVPCVFWGLHPWERQNSTNKDFFSHFIFTSV